ncbi:DUF1016 domain-containing protein [Candidatus Woesearchaeota archaeon]|nr:DUF1016 domain-containing protein [Candidatus Woesearchaeota archaeon]
MIPLTQKTDYNSLISQIGNILETGRKQAYIAIDSILVKTYWEIGKQIVDYEQHGQQRAIYGKELLVQISKDLKLKYGKGFSRSNLQYMRLVYLKYPICQTLSGKLSWSHYVELLGIEEDTARAFYEKQCIYEKWSVRELKRQINSMLFHRIALSKDKKGVMELARNGHIVSMPEDVIRDPYVLEFLNISQDSKYTEKELEQKIIDNLQKFLLELGKGFAFIGRQYRISFGGQHYYIDLVFYNRILKCFVLFDLKIGAADHLDIGQMNLYLNYFKDEEMHKEDNEPIGIILAADKNNLLVKYALGSISNKMFVSKYKLYLPDKKMLEDQLRKALGGD